MKRSRLKNKKAKSTSNRKDGSKSSSSTNPNASIRKTCVEVQQSNKSNVSNLGKNNKYSLFRLHYSFKCTNFMVYNV